MEDMLWIEDIVESTPTPPFFFTRWLLKGMHFQPFPTG